MGHFYAQKQTNSMSAIQFSARAAVAPKISLRKSSKVSVRTGVRAQAVAAPAGVSADAIQDSINSIRFLAIDAINKSNSGHPGLFAYGLRADGVRLVQRSDEPQPEGLHVAEQRQICLVCRSRLHVAILFDALDWLPVRHARRLEELQTMGLHDPGSPGKLCYGRYRSHHWSAGYGFLQRRWFGVVRKALGGEIQQAGCHFG